MPKKIMNNFIVSRLVFSFIPILLSYLMSFVLPYDFTRILLVVVTIIMAAGGLSCTGSMSLSRDVAVYDRMHPNTVDSNAMAKNAGYDIRFLMSCLIIGLPGMIISLYLN